MNEPPTPRDNEEGPVTPKPPSWASLAPSIATVIAAVVAASASIYGSVLANDAKSKSESASKAATAVAERLEGRSQLRLSDLQVTSVGSANTKVELASLQFWIETNEQAVEGGKPQVATLPTSCHVAMNTSGGSTLLVPDTGWVRLPGKPEGAVLKMRLQVNQTWSDHKVLTIPVPLDKDGSRKGVTGRLVSTGGSPETSTFAEVSFDLAWRSR